MRIRSLIVIVGLALVCATAAVAEEAPAAPQPTAEHKLLEKWIGHWAGTGELKPGPMGPGGTWTWTEECSWFGETKFTMICKSKGDGPMGPVKGLGIISYNIGRKVYTHYGVDSSGWNNYSEGSVSGDVWTFQGKETVGDKTFHSRFKMNMAEPNKTAFVWEISEDGENWTVLMDGVNTRK